MNDDKGIVSRVQESIKSRREIALSLGAIPLSDTLDSDPPEGWELDPFIYCYIPPNVILK